MKNPMLIGWQATCPSLSPFYAVLRRVPLLYGVSRRAVFASLSWLVLLGGEPFALGGKARLIEMRAASGGLNLTKN